MSIILGAPFFGGLIYVGAFIILIILIVRRVKEKKNESFEKRDN